MGPQRHLSRKGVTPAVLAAFFALATVLTLVAAASLVFPDGPLRIMWAIKPKEFEQLLSYGPLVPAGFLFLTLLMAAASFGSLKRARWGWLLALIIFAANGFGDALRIPFAPAEGLLGVAVTGTILWWLTRPRVRQLFH